MGAKDAEPVLGLIDSCDLRVMRHMPGVAGIFKISHLQHLPSPYPGYSRHSYGTPNLPRHDPGTPRVRRSTLLGDHSIRPLDEGDEDCWITELGVPVSQIRVDDTACSTAGAAGVDLDFLRDDFLERLG